MPMVRRALVSLGFTLAVSTLLVFFVELIARGSFADSIAFLSQPHRPGWSTVVLIVVLAIGLDALLGRRHNGFLIIGPIFLVLAFVGQQKSLYLGDPLYPTDFLYSRQIVELMPLLVGERPIMALATVLAVLVSIGGLVWSWRYWRRRADSIAFAARLSRLAIAVPALVAFASMMDYATFSWVRDRLQIVPMMWDQKENYRSNGFTLAFALNLPMAKVSAPAGYSERAVNAIGKPGVAIALPDEQPDIIMVMNESFWDPTRLPDVTIKPDPIGFIRSTQSGHVFSPEFGGMTANVEFEALTGFSNAFLPTGSIPYQQYIRTPIPSLATFLRSEGYETRAIHPFAGWFWNRSMVYQALGFETFMSEETLPKLKKRGTLASDAALVGEIIRQADAQKQPFFFFAVTLQGHGPYPPGRYGKETRHEVEANTTGWARDSIATFAEGAADADDSLKTLVEWARKRERPTVIAFFGDHLPPLGDVYVQTGFMEGPVAPRRAPLDDMMAQHETPLLVWSNKTGTERRIGTISPAFLPLHVLESAGISHPYYTGFLGKMRGSYKVIDRNLLLGQDGAADQDWLREPKLDRDLKNFRLLQYDMMFGGKHGTRRYFPELIDDLIADRPASPRRFLSSADRSSLAIQAYCCIDARILPVPTGG
ncbi:LTA synthase family protein [Oryzicola mucosus]